jgi:hypothetical protein
MSVSVLFARGMLLTTVEVEVRGALDGQGKPSYATPVTIEARTRLETRMLRQPAGTHTTSDLTVYVPDGQVLMPGVQDRLTAASVFYIVAEIKDVRTIRTGNLVYRRLLCYRVGGG